MKNPSSLLLLVVILSNMSFAQQGVPDVKTSPDFASPDIASFMKYEDIQTNLYTGVPNIDLPIYTLTDGNVSLPINLRYHASGIKVEEEAGWVGLGWNLNVGGHVTRRTNGRIDINSYDHQNTRHSNLNTLSEENPYNLLSRPPIAAAGYDMPQIRSELFPYFGDHSFAIFQNDNDGGAIYGQVLSNGQLRENHTINNAIAATRDYFLPDTYSVTAPGISGKFVLKFTNLGEEVLFMGNEKVRIERIKTAPNYNVMPLVSQSLHGETIQWEVTLSSGIKHVFDFIEYRTNDGAYFRDKSTPATFKLTKTIYPTGEEIIYEYEELTIVNKINKSISFRVGGNHSIVSDCKGSSGFKTTYSGYSYRPSYLSKIITTNYEVLFTRSLSRLDLKGEQYLEKIEIIEKSTRDVLKKIDFNHSYFQSPNQPNNDLINDNLFKRLKLESIDVNNVLFYNMDYNESVKLPSKESFDQDYWGFYNGANNTTLLPNPYKLGFSSYTDLPYKDGEGTIPIGAGRPGITLGDFSNNNLFRSLNANRKTSSDFVDASVLTTLTHPTGGKTTYEFEPHTSENLYYPSNIDVETEVVLNEFNDYYEITPTKNHVIFVTAGASMEPVLFNNNQINYQSSNAIILGTHIRVLKDGIEDYKKSVSIDPPFNSNNSIAILADNFEYELEAGHTYRFETNLSNNALSYNGQVGIELKFSYHPYFVGGADSFITEGGGLRIKSIKKRDKNSTVLLEREYVYEFDGMTTGKLMSPVKFVDRDYYFCPDQSSPSINGWINWADLTLTSQNSSAISDAAQGAPVGYSKVLEVYKGNNDQFFTEFLFFNKTNYGEIDGKFPEVPHLMNGNRLSTKSFDRNQKLLSENSESYKKVVDKWHYGFYAPRKQYINDFVIDAVDPNISEYEFNEILRSGSSMVLYPYLIPASTYALDKSVSKQYYYDSNDVLTSTVINESNYTYNALGQLESQQAVNSTQDGLTTVYKYPVDYNTNASPVINTLVYKNIIGAPVNVETYYNDKLVSGKTIQYNDFGLPEHTYMFEKQDTDITSNFNPSQLISSNYNIESDIKYHPVSHRIIESSKINGVKSSFIWGYNDSYPVAQILNATYSEIEAVLGVGFNLGAGFLSSIQVSNLKQSLPDAQITTYTYKLGIGIETVTDPRGRTMTYHYDDFNRLEHVTDHEGNIVSKNEYKYATQN